MGIFAAILCLIGVTVIDSSRHASEAGKNDWRGTVLGLVVMVVGIAMLLSGAFPSGVAGLATGSRVLVCARVDDDNYQAPPNAIREKCGECSNFIYADIDGFSEHQTISTPIVCHQCYLKIPDKHLTVLHCRVK